MAIDNVYDSIDEQYPKGDSLASGIMKVLDTGKALGKVSPPIYGFFAFLNSMSAKARQERAKAFVSQLVEDMVKVQDASPGYISRSSTTPARLPTTSARCYLRWPVANDPIPTVIGSDTSPATKTPRISLSTRRSSVAAASFGESSVDRVCLTPTSGQVGR